MKPMLLPENGRSIDPDDLRMKCMAKECARTFRLAAESPDSLHNNRDLRTAKATVYQLSSRELGRAMLPYQDTQRAFFTLQGAANRLG